MVDARIKTGDLIIIKRQPTAEDGQIVVARLGNNVTLKILQVGNSKKRLCFIQKNENYEDIVIRDCDIMGVAVKK